MKQENLDYVEAVKPRLRLLLDQGRTSELLAEARQLLARDPNDINICQFVTHLLIDGGGEGRDAAAVEEGIRLVEKILNETTFGPEDEDLLVLLRYNLSNGHASLNRCHRESNPAQASSALQAQKEILQGLLLRRPQIPPDLLPAVLANYANVLDGLSRTFEAIDVYHDCLQVEPDHGLARGNCGETLRRVVFFTSSHRLENLQASFDLLSASTSNPSTITKWAGPSAYRHIAKNLERLTRELEEGLHQGLETLRLFREHRLADHSAPSPDPWLEEVVRDRLLLSFNEFPLNSKHEAVDDVFFESLAYGLSDEDRAESINLINLYNAIKEEFITARYLYYHARDEQDSLSGMNSSAVYGDPEGSAEFGLISGLLKTSFRLSIDLLDKLAVFLSIYFALGDPKKFDFNNVWFLNRDTKRGIVHPTLEPLLKSNYPLIGLRDFQRDFYRQEYPGPVKDTRNAATHRWMTLSWLPVEKASRDETRWHLDDFFALTHFLLRQSKAAILQLTAAIEVEERRRKRESGKEYLPTPLFVRKPISARAAEDLEGGLFDEDPELKEPDHPETQT